MLLPRVYVLKMPPSHSALSLSVCANNRKREHEIKTFALARAPPYSADIKYCSLAPCFIFLVRRALYYMKIYIPRAPRISSGAYSVPVLRAALNFHSLFNSLARQNRRWHNWWLGKLIAAESFSAFGLGGSQYIRGAAAKTMRVKEEWWAPAFSLSFFGWHIKLYRTQRVCGLSEINY